MISAEVTLTSSTGLDKQKQPPVPVETSKPPTAFLFYPPPSSSSPSLHPRLLPRRGKVTSVLASSSSCCCWHARVIGCNLDHQLCLTYFIFGALGLLLAAAFCSEGIRQAMRFDLAAASPPSFSLFLRVPQSSASPRLSARSLSHPSIHGAGCSTEVETGRSSRDPEGFFFFCFFLSAGM